MLKQKVRIKTYSKKLAFLSLAVLLLLSGGIYGGLVRADQFDEQIKALQQQNSSNRQASDALAAQASSYQEAVNALQQRINVLQQSITANQQKIDDLQNQIVAAQIELDHEKQVLGTNIKTMYLEGKISTLEILASSNDLSDFVNKEEYRSAVQSKIKSSLDKVTALKLELQTQRSELESRNKDLQTQQASLDSDRVQQSQLLAYTEGQKAAYDQQIKANNSQIASLRAQQLAINRRIGGNDIAGDPSHGGYPAKWDYPTPQDSTFDSWGMYNRECVSYTAWKVFQTYGYMPYWGGVGNANQWPGNAVRDGIPTGSTPKVGSVAISMNGYYGHSMWVESVNSDGTFNVSQYNKYWTGTYSETYNVSPAGLIFIYFGG